ncbi:MAG: post-COAP-1 domain-containing protein [Planctomycetota bacterium]
MRNELGILRTAALSCLLLTGKPSASALEGVAPPTSLAVDAPPTVLLGTGCLGFVTGGGSIPVGDNVGSFNFFAGVKDGFLFVGFQYVDEETGMLVKGLDISAFEPGDSDVCRHFEGEAALDGVGGFTYSVDVCDNGEPGVADTFAIDLSNGYSAGGILAGGNVQLHPCH